MAEKTFMTLLLITSVSLMVKCQPTPCCKPKQWEGLVWLGMANYVHKNDDVSLTRGTVKTTYDYTNLKEAQVQDVRVSPPLPFYTVKMTIIKDYNRGTQWEIIENNKTCTTSKLTSRMSSPCIPNTAQFQGTYLLSESMEADRWHVYDPVANQSVVYTVQSKTCWPVSETRRSTIPDMFRLTSLTFDNVTAGIRHPEIFNLPSYCPPGL